MVIEQGLRRGGVCIVAAAPVLSVLLLLAAPATGFADIRTSPGVFGGISAVTGSGSNARVGGSVDVITAAGIGVGAEGGWVGDDSGIGLVSFSGSYRFLERRPSAVSPFVIGGFTTSAFRGEARPFIHAGGGVDVWVRPGSGLRFEVRNHFGQSDFWRDRHILDFRVGYAWGRRRP